MKSIFIFMLFVSMLSIAQESDTIVIEEFPDVEAEFPGGTFELMKFVRDSIDYPSCGIGNDECITIWVQFVVRSSGKVTDVEFRRSVDSSLEEMALDLFAKMPDWIPAQKDGKKVHSRLMLPIKILLN